MHICSRTYRPHQPWLKLPSYIYGPYNVNFKVYEFEKLFFIHSLATYTSLIIYICNKIHNIQQYHSCTLVTHTLSSSSRGFLMFSFDMSSNSGVKEKDLGLVFLVVSNSVIMTAALFSGSCASTCGFIPFSSSKLF